MYNLVYELHNQMFGYLDMLHYLFNLLVIQNHYLISESQSCA